MTARHRRPRQRALTMWLLWRNGWSAASIARAYGVSSTTVTRILRVQGIRNKQHNVGL